MPCDAFMFAASKDAVLGPLASADDPNHWLGTASLCAGQCQEFAGKPHPSTESSEEPIPGFFSIFGGSMEYRVFGV